MKFEDKTLVWVFTAALSIGAVALVKAQAPAPPGGRGGGGRGGAGASLFTAADINKDGFVTHDELRTTFSKWFSDADTGKTGSITQEQLTTVVNAAMPAPAGFGGGGGRGAAGQNQTPKPEDVAKMMPDSAPAKPLKPRKVLVLCKANGFVHSSIPLAAKTIEAMGTKTGAWTTTITYDSADINTTNLQQYDVLFLDSTTGAFLDDPNDSGTTAARKAALLAFVRGGKGIAGIHAASDSYHAAAPTPGAAPGAARGGGGRGGVGGQLVAFMFTSGDKNNDQKLSGAEMTSLADAWYDKLDPDKAGKVSQADFNTRFAALMPAAAPGGGRGAGAVPQGPDNQVGTWPDFNNLIAGFFKFHWVYPQEITVKIDDPKSPLTAMFHGKEFVIHDETYTQSINSSWSRKNVHVLTSIDYDKMSPEDKAKESNPRADHDYGLSWIRREGQGRVFYEAHGHDESIYAMTPMLEHVLAGVQYAAGDLKADDSPSMK
jgi:type 1 glutamine amidotransferase